MIFFGKEGPSFCLLIVCDIWDTGQ